MRNDHRRPLVAYGFVALACALVVGQPSMTSLAGGIPGQAPVVTLLTDTGLDAAFGLPTINALRAAVGEIPDGDVTPGTDPVDDVLDGTSSDPAVVVADAPASQSGPSLSAGLTSSGNGGGPSGTGTPDTGTGGLPDDGGLFGKPESDTPRDSKGNAADDDGPKPHQFGAGKGHPYDTAQPPGPGGSGGGPDDDKPGKGPKDKSDKPGKGPKDKSDKPGKGPKDKGDKPGKGPKDKGDKPGKGPKDKSDKPGKGPKCKGRKHGR